MSSSKYYSNTCNTDSLDSSCFCYGSAPSSTYKIFDVDTGSYLCCGNINFNLYNSDLQTSTNLKQAALNDDPRCLGWWYGSNQNFDISGLVLPQPVTDFFLPDATLTNGNMPLSYGPTNTEIYNVNIQANLNKYFKLPTNEANGQGSQAVCANGNTFWLTYQNPNKGLEFVTTMVCFDTASLSTLKTDLIYVNGNWALYNANCSTGSTPSICIQSVGEMLAPPNNTKRGSLYLATPGYTGGNSIPENNKKDKDWIFWLVLILSLVAIVVIIIVLVVQYKKKNPQTMNTEQDMYETEETITVTESDTK